MAEPLTIAKINEEMLRLRSRVAVLETLITHIETNYVATNDIAPELYFQREDSGVVSQDHIQDVLAHLVDSMDKAKVEISEIENRPLFPAPEATRPAEPEVKETVAEGSDGEAPEVTEDALSDPSATTSTPEADTPVVPLPKTKKAKEDEAPRRGAARAAS